MNTETTRKVALKILIFALLALFACVGASAEAVDADALRAKARVAGLDLPRPKENERLYLGVSDVPGTLQTRLFIALIAKTGGAEALRLAFLQEAHGGKAAAGVPANCAVLP